MRDAFCPKAVEAALETKSRSEPRGRAAEETTKARRAPRAQKASDEHSDQAVLNAGSGETKLELTLLMAMCALTLEVTGLARLYAQVRLTEGLGDLATWPNADIYVPCIVSHSHRK